MDKYYFNTHEGKKSQTKGKKIAHPSRTISNVLRMQRKCLKVSGTVQYLQYDTLDA